MLETDDPEVDHYLKQVKPMRHVSRAMIRYLLGTPEGRAKMLELTKARPEPPSEPHQIVREAVDPLDPEPSMGEVHRHLPTKPVRLRGNSMLFAPNLVRMAQQEWQHGNKKRKAWALELIKSWQGLPDQLYLDILNGKCDITEEGDDAMIIIRQY